MTTEPKRTSADHDATREAKGAAREVIGKLIGDDAEVRKGRAEQDAVQTESRDARGGHIGSASDDQ